LQCILIVYAGFFVIWELVRVNENLVQYGLDYPLGTAKFNSRLGLQQRTSPFLLLATLLGGRGTPPLYPSPCDSIDPIAVQNMGRNFVPSGSGFGKIPPLDRESYKKAVEGGRKNTFPFSGYVKASKRDTCYRHPGISGRVDGADSSCRHSSRCCQRLVVCRSRAVVHGRGRSSRGVELVLLLVEVGRRRCSCHGGCGIGGGR